MKPSEDIIGKVGIVGIGNMGMAMALNLLSKAYRVCVCDIDEDRVRSALGAGATSHTSAQGLAAQCEVLIVAVVNAAQTRAVLFGEQGMLSSAHMPACVMLCPTIAPEDVEQIAAELALHGITTIDAPMSGGPQRAREGSMSLMVACPQAAFTAYQTLLKDLASQLFYISPQVGDGARTKLVNNLLASINLAGAAQCLALAQAMGLNGHTTLQVIEQSSGQSWIGSDRMQRALQGDHQLRAHMSLLAKDSALALRASPLPPAQLSLGVQAAAEFMAACDEGYEGRDDSELLNYFLSNTKRRK
jgi:L-threonate 2-dehydrogenase